MGLCLFRLLWSDSQLKSVSSFSNLHNLVEPVMIRAASLCTESSCFFEWTDALSHTESQYSNSGRGRTKDKYISYVPMICDLL